MTIPRAVLGLLGAVASGKSHVARRLAALGPGRVLEADALARAALEQAARDGRLVAALGPSALGADGLPDRAGLRARAHADPAVLRTLEGLTHPSVLQQVVEAVAAHRRGEGPPLLVLDIPLLLETGLDVHCDELWWVEVPPPLREARAAARGVSAADLARWESAQLPLAEKRRRARRVIHNDVPPAELDQQLRAALAERATARRP